MSEIIYSIEIVLSGLEPKIWRTIDVTSKIKLVDLHRILQTAMGWTNSHLHYFEMNQIRYAPIEFEIENAENSRTIRTDKILTEINDSMIYVYDLGDCWTHTITIKEIKPASTSKTVAVCTGGARRCPLEDSGGVSGYQDLLNILSDPSHPDSEDTRDFLGKNFNPDSFDLNKINRNLKKKNFGCIWL
jgi:hypothetical protein